MKWYSHGDEPTNAVEHSLNTTNNNAGFTIIEVIIVLAIAGVILGLVFGALPVFERNGRNGQRKQDIGAILDGVSRYELNNSAQFPSSAGVLNSLNLTYYTAATDVTFHDLNKSPQGPAASVDAVDIYDYQRCVPDSPGLSTSTGADYTDIVAIYAIESVGGISPQCRQL